MTDAARAFRGFRFPAEVILWAVRWYLQFPISYRDLERMLADRGVAVDHTTMYRWVQHFAPELEKRMRRHLRPCRGPWYVDETYIRISGQWGSVALAVKGALLDGLVPLRPRPKIWCTKDRCAGMSPLGTARTWPLASIAIASMPASVRFDVQKP